MARTAAAARRAPAAAASDSTRVSRPVLYQFGTDPFVGLVGRDHLPTIAGLARMADTDETIGAIMWTVYTMMGQVQWSFQAELDGVPTTTNAKSIKWAEWATSLLDDMKETFQEHVEEALSMMTLGHAPCEIVTKQRDGIGSRYSDGYYGIATLPLIDQRSIVRWNYDNNQVLQSFTQMATTGSAIVPIDKVVNYRIRAHLDRPVGRSLFNNAFRVWKLKNRIQDAEATGIERELAGMPLMRVPESEIELAAEVDAQGKPTAAAGQAASRIGAAINAVSNLRFTEKGGLVLPSDTFKDSDQDGSEKLRWDFDIITSAGQRTIDTGSSRRDYDRAIARLALMQFLHLGDRSTGSFGLSDDQSGMAVRSLLSIASKIAERWTRGPLNTVWQLNMLPMKYRPRLVPTPLTKDGIQQVGSYFTGLGKILGLLEKDPDARVQALAAGGITSSRDKQMDPFNVMSGEEDQPAADPSGPAEPGQPAPAQEPK